MTGEAPKHFRTPAGFRSWLAKHHASRTELWVLFYKKASGKGGMTYKAAVDEALCHGWIDGVMRSVDSVSFMQRFTPRKKDSHWSLVNVRRVAELEADGRMADPGRAAFARRTPERTGKASFESAPAEFTPAQKKLLDGNPAAGDFFRMQPPGYQRVVKHWVTTAKREETRERRMRLFLEHSARGERLPQFVSPIGKS